MRTPPLFRPVRLLYLLAALPLLSLGVYVLRDLSAETLSKQADGLEKTLDLEPALNVRQQAVVRSPLNEDRHLELARAAQTLWYLRDQPRYRQLAEAEYLRARQLSPSDTQPLFLQARMYSFRGQPRLALPLLNEALRIDPNNAGLVVELARDQKEAGQDTAAQVSYRRCLTIDDVAECRAGAGQVIQ